MIETKLFEVRDRMTMIPVMACRMGESESHEAILKDQERRLIRRSGFDMNYPSIYLVWLENRRAGYDPFSWGPSRTLGVAHKYIDDHWPELESGAVVDVEFILGETNTPKESEA